MLFDVVVIGGGIVGCSVARELSRYNIKTAILEKNEDVATGASKANTGIVHAGFDAVPGTAKARYNAIGNTMFESLSEELGFPFKTNGALVVCLEGQDESTIKALYERGLKNGIKSLKILDGKEVKKMEPCIKGNVKCALYAGTSGIVGPYEMTIAMAENAATNGVQFFFYKQVTAIKRTAKNFKINCQDGSSFSAKVIANAAGCFSDDINNLVNPQKFTIKPKRGEYCLFDKSTDTGLKTTIFQLPSHLGKGVVVTPTTHGNLLIGPNAVETADKDNKSTTVEGLKEVVEMSKLVMPDLNTRNVITQFSGLRAHEIKDDFIIGESADGFFNAVGIESPGITAAPAIAVDLAKQIANKLGSEQKKSFIAKRTAIPQFASMTLEERRELIKSDSRYGNIVCRCENVTEGEIVEAIKRVPGARSLDAVKRRTRAGMGRCQAGFCGPRILEILAGELDTQVTEITKSGKGTEVLLCRNKENAK